MENPLTRNLVVMSVQRRLNKTVDLIVSVKTSQLDGSFDIAPTTVPVLAAVNDLSEKQKNRIRKAGISVVSGVFCEMITEVATIPDSIKIDEQKYNIFEYVVQQGISSFILYEQEVGDQV